MAYKFLEHTADMKIQAEGKTLEQAFNYSAQALAELFTNIKKIKPTKEIKIKVKGIDEKSLLYNFLEEFLILIDSKGLIAKKVKNIKIKNLQLTAVAEVDKIKNYQIEGDVKAITYNDMKIIKKDKVKITFVVDI